MVILYALIGEIFYVAALSLWLALPALPYMGPAIPILYLIAVLVQRHRPAVLILRRFGLPAQDLAVVQHVAAATSWFSRVWWLTDGDGVHVLTRVRRITPLGTVAVFGTSGAIGHVLMTVDGWPWKNAAVVVIGVFIGTWVALEAFASRQYGRATLVFTVAWAVLASEQLAVPRFLVAPPERGAPAFFLMLAFGALWTRARLTRHRLNVRILQREARRRIAICPRYILNAPVLASEIDAPDDQWRVAVAALLAEAHAVILDVTFLDQTPSGLSWEIDICERVNIPRLYVCHASAAHRATAALTAHSAALRDAPVVSYDANGLPLGSIHAFLRSLHH